MLEVDPSRGWAITCKMQQDCNFHNVVVMIMVNVLKNRAL